MEEMVAVLVTTGAVDSVEAWVDWLAESSWVPEGENLPHWVSTRMTRTKRMPAPTRGIR